MVALLDHLETEHAVIGGLSLGANFAYEVALRHPERLRALVLEMPVFARGVPAGRVLFSALAELFTAVYPFLTMPILVTAHAYDPVHSQDDAAELVAGLPEAARIDLRSIFDFVLRHQAINCEVGTFLRGLPPVTPERCRRWS